MNIYEKLLEQLAKRPDSAALIDTVANSTRYTTYAQLVHLIEQGAANLKRQGIHDGDTVLVLQGLSLELYVTLLALMKLGATVMIIDPSMPAATLKECCRIARPKAVVGGFKGLVISLLNKNLRSIPQRITAKGVMRSSQAIPVPTFNAWPGTPALITFTSGTTSTPKAICRTHQFLLDQHEALEQALELRSGSRQLVTLPVFVLSNLASGVTSVLPNTDTRTSRMNAASVMRHLRETGVTEILASPAFVERLCEYAAAHDHTFNRVVRVYTGGAPVLPSSYKKISSTFPQATIYGVYGSTEAEPIAKVDYKDIGFEDMQAMVGGAGLLAGHVEDSVELAIIDSEWQPENSEAIEPRVLAAKMLGKGRIGEICVAGNHVVESYMNVECNRESKIVIRQNADSAATTTWHRTGDAGYIDDRGRLWLLGRLSARIKDEFGELYPLAFETQIMEQASVKKAAIVNRRQARALVVESKERSKVEALKRVALAANVQRIIFVTSLPVDSRHNSKVDYRALHKILDAAS